MQAVWMKASSVISISVMVRLPRLLHQWRLEARALHEPLRSAGSPGTKHATASGVLQAASPRQHSFSEAMQPIPIPVRSHSLTERNTNATVAATVSFAS